MIPYLPWNNFFKKLKITCVRLLDPGWWTGGRCLLLLSGKSPRPALSWLSRPQVGEKLQLFIVTSLRLVLTCSPLQWLPMVSKARSSMQVSDKSILTRCGNDAKTLISGRMNIQTKLWWGKWNSNNWLDNNKETKRTNTHIWTELPYEQLGHNISLAAELYTAKTRATQLQNVYAWYLHIHLVFRILGIFSVYISNLYLVSTYLLQ